MVGTSSLVNLGDAARIFVAGYVHNRTFHDLEYVCTEAHSLDCLNFSKKCDDFIYFYFFGGGHSTYFSLFYFCEIFQLHRLHMSSHDLTLYLDFWDSVVHSSVCCSSSHVFASAKENIDEVVRQEILPHLGLVLNINMKK